MRPPTGGEPVARPNPSSVAALGDVGSATACAKLHQLGLSRTFVDGPRPLHELGNRRVVGGAITLQFMPKREDVFSGAEQEDVEKTTALWAVLEAVEPGDVLVVQAYGSRFTGCLGDMLVRYFRKRGGAGIVVDGRIRDAARVKALGVPVWCTGVTPHYASQSELFPWAWNVPVAVGGALVFPGDIMVADDDGAVVVPPDYAGQVAESAMEHQDREEFARERIDAGGRLSDYYPLSSANEAEYVAARGARRAGLR